MSLPFPGTRAPLDPQVLQEMDAPLIALANKSGGDLRQLLYAFFSFLHRRTDFYLVPNEEDVKDGVPIKMGFREGDAEKLLLAAFRQFPLRRMPRQVASTGAKKAVKTKEKVETQREELVPETKETPSKAAPKRNVSEKSATIERKKEKETTDAIRLTEDGKQVPVGNGGTTKNYTWTQTLDECTVLLAVPEGTRGKDLSVTIKASSVSVCMKKSIDDEESPRTLLNGDLAEKIRPDESTWSLEGGVLVLTLDKMKKTWWETVLVGDDKIDTTLVDSRRRIEEYDDSTQAAIRKILFDQRQQRLGQPTSDEILRDKPLIPPLPDGVEYIDQETLDKQADDPS